MANYTPPQTLLYQEYQQVAPAITVNLAACIVGPHAYLLRHSALAEKPLGKLGTYAPNVGGVFAWPGRPVGAVVDPDYTKVFVDKARMDYLAIVTGTGSAVTPVAGVKNQIRWADTTGSFQANGSTYPRYAGLLDRDVQPGDLVRLSGVGDDSTTYALDSYVLAVASTGASRIAATLGTAAPAATNGTTGTAAATVTPADDQAEDLALTATLTGYSSLAAGLLDDTYTVTVIRASTGGNLTTARLSLTSASGGDDVANFAPAAAASATTVGSRGLALTFTADEGTPDLRVGQSWTVTVRTAYTAPALTIGGAYTGTAATTYIVTCTRGGLFASGTPPQITVSSTTGVDASGPTTITATGMAVALGTHGATVMVAATGTPIGLLKGDSWTVPVTPDMDGAFRTLTLGHNLPAHLLTASGLNLTLSLVRDIQVPATSDTPGVANWTQTADALTLTTGLRGHDPSWTDGGVPRSLPITGGTVYVEYRAFRTDHVAAASVTDDVTSLAGPIDPDNPLVYALYKALANSNGAAVTYIAVADPASLDAWAAALDKLIGRTDVYNVVALTTNRAVQDLVAAYVEEQSSPEAGRWSGAFMASAIDEVLPVVTAATTTNDGPALATFTTLAGGASDQAIVVEVPTANAQFVTNGVLPGDILRTGYAPGDDGTIQYHEYVVDRVLTEDALQLVTGPAVPVAVARLIEVWHPLSKDEQAAAIGTRSATFATRRICAVWPDTIGSAGIELPGYYLCAALAGQVSGSAPHRGLTNVAVLGFDDASRSSKYFNAFQMNTMAGAGTWIVIQDPDGTIKNRHALTTDSTDVNSREEMVRRNVDSISLFLQERLRPFIGVMNVAPNTVERIRTELKSAIEFIKSNGTTDLLGAQLIDATVVSVAQHTVFKDQVVAVVDIIVPAPLNRLTIHLVIS